MALNLLERTRIRIKSTWNYKFRFDKICLKVFYESIVGKIDSEGLGVPFVLFIPDELFDN